MRLAGAFTAAVLLSIASVANGCKPSSLTPFGVGYQNYSVNTDNVNGNWAGKTANGGAVSFQVGNDTVSNWRLLHVTSSCTLTFEDLSTLFPVVDNEFTIEIILDQGRFVATGRFTSTTAASGTYFFEGLQAGLCGTAGTGTFTATKTL